MRLPVNYFKRYDIKWSEILEKKIRRSEWTKLYQNNYLSVTETSQRGFQYQILLTTIPAQKYLAKCKLVSSDKYWFCKEGVETIEHLDATRVSVDIRNNINYINVLFGRCRTFGTV